MPGLTRSAERRSPFQHIPLVSPLRGCYMTFGM